MSKGPQKVRGTQDMIGEEADRFNAVVAAFDRVRRLYAFQRVETPVFEATESSPERSAKSPTWLGDVHFRGRGAGLRSAGVPPVLPVHHLDGGQQIHPAEGRGLGAAFVTSVANRPLPESPSSTRYHRRPDPSPTSSSSPCRAIARRAGRSDPSSFA